MPNLLFDLKEILIIDPYLKPIDIIETACFCKAENIVVKALCIYKEIQGNKDTKLTTNDFNEFKNIIKVELDDALGENTDLALDYRTIRDNYGIPFHDRYLILKYETNGNRVYSLGTSINSIGKKHTIIQAVDAPNLIVSMIDDIWQQTEHTECILYKNK